MRLRECVIGDRSGFAHARAPFGPVHISELVVLSCCGVTASNAFCERCLLAYYVSLCLHLSHYPVSSSEGTAEQPVIFCVYRLGGRGLKLRLAKGKRRAFANCDSFAHSGPCLGPSYPSAMRFVYQASY